MALTPEELESLKSTTRSLMNHVHWVKQSFKLTPDKEHYGVCINFVDKQEYRNEFCTELVTTITEWVYSQKKASLIVADFVNENRSVINAYSALNRLAFEKFRIISGKQVYMQGQFGELLLFNFLQTFFNAVPLVRKMPITSSTEMERFGADAIHYGRSGDKNLIYLGEAKTYTSSYQFRTALSHAVESIITSYKNHRKELNLYIYDDFVDDKLQQIARDYKNGTLSNVEVHLVSIVTYNETTKFDRTSEAEIKTRIISILEEKCKALDKELFDCISVDLHTRFNYILFPVWQLDQLITDFQKLIGK